MLHISTCAKAAFTFAFCLLLLSSQAAFPANDNDEDPALKSLADHPPIPADNESATAIYPANMGPKQRLGYLLFFDKRLSGNGSISCATCHRPDEGWASGEPISDSDRATSHWRNGASIVNSGYYNKLFWDGLAPNLEAGALSCARNAMAQNAGQGMMESRLGLTPQYKTKWAQIFGSNNPKIEDAWRAIASFARYLSQSETPFDRFIDGDQGAISQSARNGFELFQGKANCVECHNGPFLTDEKYYNTGVPNPPSWETSGLEQISFRFAQYAKGVEEEIYRTTKEDLGLFYSEKSNEHKMKFRTPSIRYSKYTAPFMHNGVLATLEDVVNFYDAGGGDNDPYFNKTSVLGVLGLTPEEKSDLIEFILSTSGEEIKLEAPTIPRMKNVPDWEPKK